jgi:hypothetical protein
MTWANASDITGRWVGSGVPTDTALVDALISDAEQIILATYPGIQARIDDDLLPVERVIFVVSQMVTRTLRNPEGLTSWQQSTGPFSQSRSFNSSDGALGIYMTDNETKLLAPNMAGKAFEIDLAPNAAVPTLYVIAEEEDSSEVWERVDW